MLSTIIASGQQNAACLTIDTGVEELLREFFTTKCKQLRATLLEQNMVEDHIHLLLSLRPTHRLSALIHDLKGGSSHYVNHHSGFRHALFWQLGYSVETCSIADLPRIQEYVRDQKIHHQSGMTISKLEP